MKHRYGRHGDKAWLRWRKKHFRQTSLTPATQMAVLHVPLEFLSRIRKVTILMADGTEQIMELLPSSSVNGDTEKIGVVMLEQIPSPSPQEKFFDAAKEVAREEAGKVFSSAVNPYKTNLDEDEIKKLALHTYLGTGLTYLVPKWKLSNAQEDFLREYEIEYEKCIGELSVEHKALTEETKTLLVFARTDKRDDKGTSPEYADDRARARAYISLGSNGSLRHEDLNEHVFDNSHERVRLYQKFYDEFKPAKEGH